MFTLENKKILAIYTSSVNYHIILYLKLIMVPVNISIKLEEERKFSNAIV